MKRPRVTIPRTEAQADFMLSDEYAETLALFAAQAQAEQINDADRRLQYGNPYELYGQLYGGFGERATDPAPWPFRFTLALHNEGYRNRVRAKALKRDMTVSFRWRVAAQEMLRRLDAQLQRDRERRASFEQWEANARRVLTNRETDLAAREQHWIAEFNRGKDMVRRARSSHGTAGNKYLLIGDGRQIMNKAMMELDDITYEYQRYSGRNLPPEEHHAEATKRLFEFYFWVFRCLNGFILAVR